MTTPTYSQASTPTDQPTYRANTLALLANPPAPLQPAPVAGWSARAPQRLLVEDFANQMATESSLRAAIAQTVSPQTAANAGPDWVRAVIGWFDEDFLPAVAAVWSVQFQCTPSAAPITVDNSSTIQIQSTDGQIFLCTQPTAVVFNSASSYQGLLQFTARNPGIAGNVAAANILAGKVLTGPAGLSIGPGTPTVVTQGRDIETPLQAIQRCLGKWARLGAGWTRQAYDFLIPAGSPTGTVTRWRVRDDNPLGPGSITAALAGASGPSTTPEVSAVQAYLESPAVRSLATGIIYVYAAAADPLTVNVTIKGDGSNANLQSDIQAAGAALASLFPIGLATLDNVLFEAVLLGGAFNKISIVGAAGEVLTIDPPLPGFGGAISIQSIDLVAPHVVPDGAVLELTLNVTVV
jgi:hypothetical protein